MTAPMPIGSLWRFVLLLCAVIVAGLIVALLALLHALWVTVTRPLIALSDLFMGRS